ncbi:hypothetical protein Agub_g4429, partial [Astrephomene gubernaculifera]
AAFAAAGHFNGPLCGAIANRTEALARTAARPTRSSRAQKDPAAVAAAALSELLAVLQSLARLGFHNEAALAAAVPAVAATLPALPPQAIVAALEAYGMSGVPPLGLMSALAGELVERL